MLFPLLVSTALAIVPAAADTSGALAAGGAGSRAAALAPAHDLVDPSQVGMRLSELLRAEATVAARTQDGAFPGAALAVGRGEHAVLERGFGRLDWAPTSPAADPDYTIYDLASLTKVVATTTAVMILVEDGKMVLDAPVSTYLPEFSGGAKALVTVRDLLMHTSGLPAWTELRGRDRDAALRRAIATPLERQPGARVEYSDVGFIVLWAAAEAAAGEPLYRVLEARVFVPLGMRSTTFLAGDGCRRCAPTGRSGDGRGLRGVVHDPLARQLGGITGNAGLFSTAHDLGRFAAMLAAGGQLDGRRILREETVREFTARQPGAGTRALGWDTPDARGSGAAGLGISPNAFGHTGFTGTSLWIDPDRGTWVVLLSNRTYEPRAAGGIQSLRRSVNDWIASSASESPPSH